MNGQWIKLYNNQLIVEEVFEVECDKIIKLIRNKKENKKYKSLFVQIINKFNPIKLKKNLSNVNENASCRPLNIMLLSYDSVSRISWIKRLPKTSRFVFDTMKFDLLKGNTILVIHNLQFSNYSFRCR